MPGSTLLSCQYEKRDVSKERISTDKIWIDSLESDGILGATELGDMNDFN